MTKYEFSIAVTDEPEATRKKEGDIISIIPYGAEWGSAVLGPYLIVILELKEKEISVVRRKLIQPIYEAGHIEWVTFRAIRHRNYETFDVYQYPAPEYCVNFLTGQPMLQPIMLRKFRYCIPLANIVVADLDLKKVRNKKYLYQPMKKETQLVKKSEKLNVGDVDCGIDPEKEVSIKMTDKLIKDNFTGLFVDAF